MVTRVTGDYHFDQAQPVTGVTWENGVSLVAYRARWASATELTVDTLLRVEADPPANADYHWYVHLFNGDQRVAQHDSSGAHPSFWLKGDMILQRSVLRVEAPLAPGAQLRLRIGSYTFPSVKAVLVTVPPGGAREGGVNLPLP